MKQIKGWGENLQRKKDIIEKSKLFSCKKSKRQEAGEQRTFKACSVDCKDEPASDHHEGAGTSVIKGKQKLMDFYIDRDAFCRDENFIPSELTLSRKIWPQPSGSPLALVLSVKRIMLPL